MPSQPGSTIRYQKLERHASLDGHHIGTVTEAKTSIAEYHRVRHEVTGV